jgi:pyridine nucleotide-disulfide oxidoreductase family protein
VELKILMGIWITMNTMEKKGGQIALITETSKKVVILVGGGHAHVNFINQFSKEKFPGIRVVLVSNYNRQYYSGMASGFLEGIYDLDDISFDLPKMCEASGIEFIEDTVIGVDPSKRKIFLENGWDINFHAISLDVGSETVGKDMEGVKDNAITIKPLKNLLTIKEKIEKTGDNARVVIVGAGAAGLETGLAIKEFSKKQNKDLKISIINSSNVVLKNDSSSVREKVVDQIRKNEIDLYLNEKIIEVNQNFIQTEASKTIHFDILIWATGTAAVSFISKTGCKTDENGYLLVNKYLQSVNYPFVFGAGDCIAFEEYKYVKKVGVYAIRAAPYLFKNMMAYIENRKLNEFIPQKSYLYIVSIGSRLAVLYYKGIVYKGRLAWRMKDFIDRNFMKKHKKYRR